MTQRVQMRKRTAMRIDIDTIPRDLPLREDLHLQNEGDAEFTRHPPPVIRSWDRETDSPVLTSVAAWRRFSGVIVFAGLIPFDFEPSTGTPCR